jgi:hypothetical protein
MKAPDRLTMSSDDFLAWENRQEEKHKFVRGRIRMMADATRAHQTIRRNTVIALTARLRGQPCHAYGEQRIAIRGGNGRYADVCVDCSAAIGMTDTAAAEARVALGVECPSTPFLVEMERVEDYQAFPTMAHIVVLAQDRARGRGPGCAPKTGGSPPTLSASKRG